MADHPITPPPELVQQWMTEAHDQPPGPDARVIATQAARWGADQELEACVKWVSEYCPYFGDYPMPEDKLRAARRPKPPSLKEQALELVETYTTPSGRCGAKLTPEQCDIIHRALKQLPDTL